MKFIKQGICVKDAVRTKKFVNTLYEDYTILSLFGTPYTKMDG